MRTLVGVFVFAVAFGSQVATATDPNTFICREAGLTITKPQQWAFVTRATEKDVRGEVGETGILIAALIKDPKLIRDWSPGVTVFVIETDELIMTTPNALVKFALRQIEDDYGDSEIKEGPVDVTFAGLKGVYAFITARAVKGLEEPATVCMEIWVVMAPKETYIIDAWYRQDERTGTRKEVKQVIDSIKLSPKSLQPAGAAGGPVAK